MTSRRLGTVGLAILLAAISVPSPPFRQAEAADIGSTLDRAKAAAARNDHNGAIDALQMALETLRTEAPLELRPFHVVSRPAKVYGDYEPRKDAVFRRGEQIHFYMEPKNLVYSRTAAGTYEPSFEVDVQVLSSDGQVLLDQPRANSFRFASKSRVQDIFLNLKLSLTGAPAGEYRVKFVVRDANSKKTATAVQPVTLK